jgi:hypothetical protein
VGALFPHASNKVESWGNQIIKLEPETEMGIRLGHAI